MGSGSGNAASNHWMAHGISYMLLTVIHVCPVSTKPWDKQFVVSFRLLYTLLYCYNKTYELNLKDALRKLSQVSQLWVG